MYDLSGKVALVTGAGGRNGIGRAIALRLAQEGAAVVVTDIQRSTDRMRAEDRAAGWRGLPSVVEEIENLGRRSLGRFSDVSDSAQVAYMVQQTLDDFGHIDILVNNAGSQPGRDRVPVIELEEDAFDEVMRGNVRGTYLCSNAGAIHMIGRGGGGKIIIISSGAGKQGIARYAAYCSSKFALIGFTQALAQEMGRHKKKLTKLKKYMANQGDQMIPYPDLPKTVIGGIKLYEDTSEDETIHWALDYDIYETLEKALKDSTSTYKSMIKYLLKSF